MFMFLQRVTHHLDALVELDILPYHFRDTVIELGKLVVTLASLGVFASE